MTEAIRCEFTVGLVEESEGGFSVQCVELPGAISQGDTIETALKNIEEAIIGYIKTFPEEFDKIRDQVNTEARSKVTKKIVLGVTC